MNYIEKVECLIELDGKPQKNNDYFVDIVIEISRWQVNELDKLLQNYYFVSESYIKFIEKFDNLGLSFVTFYGSDKAGGIKLKEEIEELSEYTDVFRQKYFPFGKDVDGSVFAIAQDQSIVWFDIQDYNFENEPKKIADNFESFITDYVLGPKCEYNHIEDADFPKLLRKLKWV